MQHQVTCSINKKSSSEFKHSYVFLLKIRVNSFLYFFHLNLENYNIKLPSVNFVLSKEQTRGEKKYDGRDPLLDTCFAKEQTRG